VRQQYQDRVLALDVRDHNGETVLNVTLRLEVTRFPARRIEHDRFAVAGPFPNPPMLSARANSR
jgi:hypothetical protein